MATANYRARHTLPRSTPNWNHNLPHYAYFNNPPKIHQHNHQEVGALALSPNKVSILHLTRLRHCASLADSCVTTHIRVPVFVVPRSSVFVDVEFSRPADTRVHRCRQMQAQGHARRVAHSRPTFLRKRQRELSQGRSVAFRWASRRQTRPRQTFANGIECQCNLAPLHSPTAFRTTIHIDRKHMFEQPRPRFPTRVADIRVWILEIVAKQGQLHGLGHRIFMRWHIRFGRCASPRPP